MRARLARQKNRSRTVIAIWKIVREAAGRHRDPQLCFSGLSGSSLRLQVPESPALKQALEVFVLGCPLGKDAEGESPRGGGGI